MIDTDHHLVILELMQSFQQKDIVIWQNQNHIAYSTLSTNTGATKNWIKSTLSLRFNGHFPGEPGLAGVWWSKGWWMCWWQLKYWSYMSCKAPVKSSPPTNQHPVFLQTRCLSCRSTNSVKALKWKYHIPRTCLPQTHLGSFNFVFDH